MKYSPTRTLSVSLLGIAALMFLLTACRKEYSTENGSSVTLAEGSLWDDSGNCFSGTLGGTWYDGVTPNPDTNYVDLTVNVTKVGYYSIYTDTQNGLYLADSGTFTATGSNTVRLKPVGTFINYGNTTFTVSFDSTTCSFTIPVQDSTGTGLGGSSSGGSGSVGSNEWRFTAGGHTYSGTVEVAAISSNVLVITGINATIDSILGMSMQLSGSTPTVGATYKTNASSGANIFEYYTNIYSSSPTYVYDAMSTTGSKVITYTITGYDASTNTVTATFEGTVANTSGSSVTLTNGAFNCTISQ